MVTVLVAGPSPVIGLGLTSTTSNRLSAALDVLGLLVLGLQVALVSILDSDTVSVRPLPVQVLSVYYHP